MATCTGTSGAMPSLGHNFPILVNSNSNMLRVTADSDRLHIDVVDLAGKVVDTLTLQAAGIRCFIGQ